MIITVIFGILIGAFFTIQAAINAKLSKYTPSVLNASLISFFIGSMLLFLMILVIDLNKLSHINFTYPLYTYLGGAICGVIFNVSSIYLFKKIGSSITTFLTVSSQIIVGAIFDANGFLNLPVKEMTNNKYIGISLMIVSIYLLNRHQKNNLKENQHSGKIKWYILASSIGILVPLQSILNGQLKTATHSPFIATFISFSVGFILLVLLTLIIQKRIVIPKYDHQHNKLPWWIYIGGLFGVLFVGGTTLIIGQLGSVLTTSLFLTGQLIMALLLDGTSIFSQDKQTITREKLMILAIMIISLFIIL